MSHTVAGKQAARDFEVVAPRRRGIVLIMLPLLAIFGIAIAMLAHSGRMRPAEMAVMLLALAMLLPLMLAILRRRRVRLVGDELVVHAGINSTRVRREDLDPAHARVVDLAERTEFAPGIKLNGSALPGYQAGHFRRLDGQRSFALVTDRHRVLVLPQRDGRRLLLSLAQPQALLDALADQGNPRLS